MPLSAPAKTKKPPLSSVKNPPDGSEDLSFLSCHLGPTEKDQQEMLALLGLKTLEDLVQAALPPGLPSPTPPELPPARSEAVALAELEKILSANQPRRSLLGLGYHGTITAPHAPP